MDRRTALQRVSLLLGGALSVELTAGILGRVLYAGPGLAVSPDQERLLAEVADVILPTTDTPGAKAAGVEKFIIRVMRDCYRPEDQQRFYEGLERLDKGCREKFGKGIMTAEPAQRAEALRTAATKDRGFFGLLRQLTVAGYFTSEIGATKALEYLPVPGKFVGEVPLAPGQKAWAL
jgi:hypothetical protein